MLEASMACPAVDVAVMVAAVADWRPETESGLKLKKVAGEPTPTLSLSENPDILATLSKAGAGRPTLVIGFAAETNDVIRHAQAKLQRKGCDWIVANDVSGNVMGGADNTVSIITADGVETWPELAKDDVARRLALRIARALT
jgi:phosphopantothenoylcysteine decarboxylase / phosphopantothenate---cysteine ligase